MRKGSSTVMILKEYSEVWASAITNGCLSSISRSEWRTATASYGSLVSVKVKSLPWKWSKAILLLNTPSRGPWSADSSSRFPISKSINLNFPRRLRAKMGWACNSSRKCRPRINSCSIMRTTERITGSLLSISDRNTTLSSQSVKPSYLTMSSLIAVKRWIRTLCKQSGCA